CTERVEMLTRQEIAVAARDAGDRPLGAVERLDPGSDARRTELGGAGAGGDTQRTIRLVVVEHDPLVHARRVAAGERPRPASGYRDLSPKDGRPPARIPDQVGFL